MTDGHEQWNSIREATFLGSLLNHSCNRRPVARPLGWDRTISQPGGPGCLSAWDRARSVRANVGSDPAWWPGLLVSLGSRSISPRERRERSGLVAQAACHPGIAPNQSARTTGAIRLGGPGCLSAWDRARSVRARRERSGLVAQAACQPGIAPNQSARTTGATRLGGQGCLPASDLRHSMVRPRSHAASRPPEARIGGPGGTNEGRHLWRFKSLPAWPVSHPRDRLFGPVSPRTRTNYMRDRGAARSAR